ncbi:MAG: Fe-S protein assembly co-chaperone HscB, partial [Caldimonas sp.]
MLLDRDDFTLFGLPPRFTLDEAELASRRRSLQAEVHPDRFAAAGAAAQRAAMQWAVRVNEAYRRLHDPLKRAAYLCELNGASIDAEDNTAMPAEFLVQQMAWREALDDARTRPEVEAIGRRIDAHRSKAYAELARALDESADFA